MEVPADLPLMAYTKREDPRDVLIYKPGREEIPQNGRIGTSSRRRMIQLEKLFPGRIYTGIRGNVQTRLQKLKEQDYDATILAAAGIKRLGMEQAVGRYFSVQEMIPAAGQGILAVQGRKGEWETLASCLNHPESEIAAKTERRFVEALNGGCSSPIAAFAEIKSREFCLYGLYYRESDGAWFVETKNGTWEEAEKAGENLAVCMKQKYGE